MAKSKGRKRTTRTRTGSPRGLVRPVPAVPEVPTPGMAEPNGESLNGGKEESTEPPRYAFPSVARCPRCNSADTIVYSTQGNIQYRRCRSQSCAVTSGGEVCRFKVVGVEV